MAVNLSLTTSDGLVDLNSDTEEGKLRSDGGINSLPNLIGWITKAKQIGQTTRKYLEMSKKFQESGRYFEFFARIQLQPNPNFKSTLDDEDNFAHNPVVTYRYPPATDSTDQLIPYLCYPDFNTVRPVPPAAKRQFFVLILTNEFGARKYAYCLKYSLSSWSQDQFPEVVTMVSPVSNRQKYFGVLDMAANGLEKDFAKDFELFIQTVYNLKPPTYHISMEITKNSAAVGGCRKRSTAETFAQLGLMMTGIAIKDWDDSNTQPDFSYLLDAFGVDKTVAIMAALLQERRIVLVGTDVPQLCHLIQATTCMLRPFEWPHTLVPVVPHSHLFLCSSPSHYVMGILRQSGAKLIQLLEEEKHNDVVIVEANFGYNDSSRVENWSAQKESLNWLPKGLEKSLRQKLSTAERAVRQKISLINGVDVETFVSSSLSEWFRQLIGHFDNHLYVHVDPNSDTPNLAFETEEFVNGVKSTSHRDFLSQFVKTGVFQIWIDLMIQTRTLSV